MATMTAMVKLIVMLPALGAVPQPRTSKNSSFRTWSVIDRRNGECSVECEVERGQWPGPSPDPVLHDLENDLDAQHDDEVGKPGIPGLGKHYLESSVL